MNPYRSIQLEIPDKRGVHWVAGTTSFLSILGAVLIILSYILLKDLRTTVRLILLHLSIMDMGSALSHLVGILVGFDNHYLKNVTNVSNTLPQYIIKTNVSLTIVNLCRGQAFASAYFNYGAFLWTSSLAIYIYIRIVHFKAKGSRCIFWSCFCVSYLAPVPLATWLFVEHHIGYSPFGSNGWCGLKVINATTGIRHVFVVAVGYDLLQYSTFIISTILYIGVHMYIRQQVI